MADEQTSNDIETLRKVAEREMPDIDTLYAKHRRLHAKLIGVLAGSQEGDATDIRRKLNSAERSVEEGEALANYIQAARDAVHQHDVAAETAEAERQASAALEEAAKKIEQAAQLADDAKHATIDGIQAVQKAMDLKPQGSGNSIAVGSLAAAYQDARAAYGSPLVGDSARLAELAQTARNLAEV